MTTSTKHHRPAPSKAVAVLAIVSALSAGATSAAHAVPDRLHDAPAVVDGGLDPPNRSVERPCFLTRPTWNEAIDGPVPRCLTYLS